MILQSGRLRLMQLDASFIYELPENVSEGLLMFE